MGKEIPDTMVYHLVRRDAWPGNVLHYRPASLALEGFVHCSRAMQLKSTLQRYFAGADDVMLIALDRATLGDQLCWEDTAGHGMLFPHLYAALPLAAVRWISPLRANGQPALMAHCGANLNAAIAGWHDFAVETN